MVVPSLDSRYTDTVLRLMSTASIKQPEEKRADGKRIREEKQRRWKAKTDKRNQQVSAGPDHEEDRSLDHDDHQETSRSRSSTRNEWEPCDVPAPPADSGTSVADSRKRPRTEDPSSLKHRVDRWISQRCYARRVAGEDLDLADPALAPFGNLRDSNLTAREGMFVAEGTETVRLLLQQGPLGHDGIRIRSIACKPSVLMDPPVCLVKDIERVMDRHGHASDTGTRAGCSDEPPRHPFEVLVADEKVQNQLTGYDGSRGAMACGYIPRSRDEAWLMGALLSRRESKDRMRLLAVDGVSDTSNLGSMIRSASAFGVDAIIMSDNTCDAWYRRCIRVSMGHVFRVPTVRVKDLASVLQRLRERYQVKSYAAVLDDCDLVLERVERGSVSHSWCCVLGNESTGVSDATIRACEHRIRIDMAHGVDSLSVPIATAILLHGLKEREGACPSGPASLDSEQATDAGCCS